MISGVCDHFLYNQLFAILPLMLRTTLLFLALLVVVAACVYDPKGEYLDPIEPPDGSGTAINLSLTMDPIVLSTTTAFTFNIMPSGKANYAVHVTYDDIPVLNENRPNNVVTFSLTPQGHPANGKLVISVAFLSESKSIAGQLGSEVEVISNTWDVIVDTVPPEPIEAPTITIEDGKSIIRWTPPSKFNIKEMILIRINNLDHLDTLRIPDIHSTEFHDAFYLGGDVKYRIDMKSGTYVTGKTSSFTCLPFNPVLDPKTGIISWEKPLLYGNNLTLRVNDNLVTWNQPGAFDPHVLFGQTMGVAFTLLPAIVLPDNHLDAYNISIIASRGLKLPFESQSIRYHAAANAYFMTTNTEVVKIDPVTFKEVGRLYVAVRFEGLSLSHNGTYAYLSDINNIYRFDPVSFQITETIPLKSLLGSPFDMTVYWPPAISDNNVMVVVSDNGENAIDMNTRTLLWRKTGQPHDIPVISPDGNFILEAATVYKRNGNSWDLYGTLTGSEPIYYARTFITENGNNLMLTTGDTTTPLYFFDLNAAPSATGEMQPTNLLQQNGWYSYDPFTATLAVKNNDHLLLYDITDWQQLTKTYDGISDQANFFLVDGVVFNDRGYYLPPN
jgi:hypothetical protein